MMEKRQMIQYCYKSSNKEHVGYVKPDYTFHFFKEEIDERIIASPYVTEVKVNLIVSYETYIYHSISILVKFYCIN